MIAMFYTVGCVSKPYLLIYSFTYLAFPERLLCASAEVRARGTALLRRNRVTRELSTERGFASSRTAVSSQPPALRVERRPRT